MRTGANARLSWRLLNRFSKRSVRGRVSNRLVGRTSAEARSLQVNSMPPRITEKSYRPRASDRTMVDTRFSPSHLACCTFQRSTGSRAHLLFLLHLDPRTVLALQGSFAAPVGAPWTAPGRSEKLFH